jgi:murein DD-endopeptidase MepM/ murein hydrolase activator NlpD
VRTENDTHQLVKRLAFVRSIVLSGVVMWIACAPSHAQFLLPRHAPYPGGVAVVKLGEADAHALEVTFGGKRVLTVRNSEGLLAVVGLPLDTQPGKQTLQVKAAAGSLSPAYATSFDVKAKAYPAQHLKISSAFMQPTAEDIQRNERDQIAIARAKNHWSDEAPANLTLDIPATGRLSARFGLRRVLNGKEGSPHAGLDVAVGTGTPLRAAAAGRVIATGDYFYSGKSVFLDHGQGFITLYIHMSRLDVKEGDSVERGAALGLSGATGRVTGPHLHWAVLLNGVYVDPELFLKAVR